MLAVNHHCGHTFRVACVLDLVPPTVNEDEKAITFECPVCRARISWGIASPEPCILVPNRLARETILDQLNILADVLAELPQVDAGVNSTNIEGKGRLGKSKPTIFDWRVGGSLRLDWEKRDR